MLVLNFCLDGKTKGGHKGLTGGQWKFPLVPIYCCKTVVQNSLIEVVKSWTPLKAYMSFRNKKPLAKIVSKADKKLRFMKSSSLYLLNIYRIHSWNLEQHLGPFWMFNALAIGHYLQSCRGLMKWGGMVVRLKVGARLTDSTIQILRIMWVTFLMLHSIYKFEN